MSGKGSSLTFRPKIAVDLMSEINPASTTGQRFILSLMDTCSRWVHCVPLKYTTSEDLANVLFSIFCRMGFPNVILDNGSQFVSRTMRSITDKLSKSQTFSCIYHLRSNGIIEKIHCCLKQMLSKVTAEFSPNWDKYL